MSTNRMRRAGVATAGAVVILGASALVQANGGLISTAFAHDDEAPKESLTQKATAQKPAPTAQAAPLAAKKAAAPAKKRAAADSSAPPK